MATSGRFTTTIHGGHYELEVLWWATQSIANNTSTIRARIYLNNDYSLNISSRTDNSIVINGKTYYYDSPAISTKGDHFLAEVYSDPIAHNSDGSKAISMSCNFKMQATISGTYYGTMTASASVTLDTIPRASTVTAGSGTLGTSQNLTVTKAATAFTHTITYKCGTASGTICTKSSATTVAFTPPLTLAAQSTTSTTVSITLTIKTYNGNTELGSNTATFNASIPSSVKPSVTVELSDPQGYASQYGGYVQGQSQLKIELTTTTAHGSAIKSYEVKVTQGSTSTLLTTNGGTVELPNEGTYNVDITVTDGRGRSGTASGSVTVQAYTEPSIDSLTVSRCEADGTVASDGAYTRILFGASVTPLKGNTNSANYRVLHRQKGTENWSEIRLPDLDNNYTVEGAAVIFATDIDMAFELAVQASDDFADKNSSTRTIPVAFVLLQSTTDGTGLGIGRRATKSNTLQVGLASEFSQPADFERLSVAGNVLQLNTGMELGFDPSKLANRPSGYTAPGCYLRIGASTATNKIYILIDSAGRFWTGRRLNSAGSITWAEK